MRAILGRPEAGRLPAAEQAELCRRAQAGDVAARHRLILASAPLAARIARRFGAPGLTADDLLQHGLIGVGLAIDRYEPTHAAKFATYAAWWVRREIRAAVLRDGYLIRVPDRRGPIGLKSGGVGDPAADVMRARACVPVGGDTGERRDRMATLEGRRDDGSPFDPEALALAMAELGREKPRDAEIVRRRYGLDGRGPETLAALAADYGIRKSGVHVAERRALEWLRRRLEAAGSGRPFSRDGRAAAADQREWEAA